jgi:DNA-binding CsgD family transcriptional regulator
VKRPVRLSALAALDLQQARDWFDARERGLGDTFLDRVNETIAKSPTIPSNTRSRLPTCIALRSRSIAGRCSTASCPMKASWSRASVIVESRALRSGARFRELGRLSSSRYLLKSSPRTDLLDAVRVVHAGRRHIPAAIAVEIAEHRSDEELTDRELDVLQRVAAARSNKIAADELRISEETVKTHMKSILGKLAARDRTHAVTIAMKRGILGR